MLNFAWYRITSFSIKPLRIITTLSIINMTLNIISIMLTIILTIHQGKMQIIYINYINMVFIIYYVYISSNNW